MLMNFKIMLNRLLSYDEWWMVNIFIWGLQPHIANSVSAQNPKTVSEAIKIAEEIEFSVWVSQKGRLNGKLVGKSQKSQKQRQRYNGKQFSDDQQQNLAENIPQAENMTVARASMQGFDDQKRVIEIEHLKSLLEDNTDRNGEVTKEKNMEKNSATIWRRKRTSPNRKKLRRFNGEIWLCIGV